ncbi:hypothetical protein PQ455_01565 [Sphingomonas naphthae]|uniref:Uncharacterized protein n=1 Tax=Sphingomonas naphthae TaxID=1813468 RepID=A0ABY7TLN9_9SPHN|nr:hypothetical protein [Sphingomonas naphthae]WCT73948.1 hypothetical protein PQ455_01565 [Sphingomonas naphthae]
MLIDPENPPSSYAADGKANVPAANTFDMFIRMLEDGEFNREMTEEMRTFASDLANAAIISGGKAKGKLTISLDFALDGRVTEIASKYKFDVPTPKRPKSIMWQTEDGRFTPNNPHQGNLFGAREVRGERNFGN